MLSPFSPRSHFIEHLGARRVSPLTAHAAEPLRRSFLPLRPEARLDAPHPTSCSSPWLPHHSAIIHRRRHHLRPSARAPDLPVRATSHPRFSFSGIAATPRPRPTPMWPRSKPVASSPVLVGAPSRHGRAARRHHVDLPPHYLPGVDEASVGATVPSPTGATVVLGPECSECDGGGLRRMHRRVRVMSVEVIPSLA